MIHALTKTKFTQQFLRARGHTGVGQTIKRAWQRDILQRVQCWKQVKTLKNNATSASSMQRQFSFRESIKSRFAHFKLARIRRVKTCKQMQQRAFTASRRTHDGVKTWTLKFKINPTHPNVSILDWYTLSKPHPEWFNSDGIHPNALGQDNYVELILQAIGR
jgi:hypothetical protein